MIVRSLTQSIRVAAWPLLLVSSSLILTVGFQIGKEAVFFNLSYAWIVLWLFLLEKHIPYKQGWRRYDGQLVADLGHTVISKGLVQILIIQILNLGILSRQPDALLGGLPLPCQVAIGLVISEIGLYWAHRIAHEWPLVWRFHAIHHSVKRLWLVNTGRFHFVDSLVSVVASLPFLLLSGISIDAVIWVSAITAYIGILTHCNVDMECGWLNYVFNTPNLHRWHHSTDREEGNRNYGENLMIWDMTFGTYRYKKGCHIATIGISEYMPATLLRQLYVPFVWRKYQSGVEQAGDGSII